MSAVEGKLTVYEAARLIGVSHAQVTRYVNQGKLAAVRVGPTILVDEDAAKRFDRLKRGNPKLLQKSS